MHRPHKLSGMTLIECLIALAIAGLIALMLVSLLSYVTRTQQHRHHRLSKEAPIHQLFVLLDRDISAMFPHHMQWASGDSSAAVAIGDQRWCWTSLHARYDTQPSWYRVCYVWRDQTLMRLVWPEGSVKRSAVVVTNRWRGIDSFQMHWPPAFHHKQANQTGFWPHVWMWSVQTAQGSWQGAARVRAWPRRKG